MSEFEEGKKEEFENKLDDIISMSMDFGERVLRILGDEEHNTQKLAITVYSMTKNMRAIGDEPAEMKGVAADMLVHTTTIMAKKVFKWSNEEIKDFTDRYNELDPIDDEEEE